MSQKYLISLALLVQMVLYVCPSISIAQQEKTPPADISADRRAFKRELRGAMQSPSMDDIDLDHRFVGVLRIMDRAILRVLNQGRPISVNDLNQELKKWAVSEPNSSESYELVEMKSAAPCYVLVAQLNTLSGVRIYAKGAGEQHYSLQARLDSDSVEGYQMAPLKFIPVDEQDGLFLTAHGRSGQTAIFYSLWRFDGQSVHAIWDSGHFFMALDRVVPGGIVITRCGDGPIKQDGSCDGTQLHYAWTNGKWQQLP